MLTRRYKKYKHTCAQAAQQCQEVKALPWNITLTCEQSVAYAGPSLNQESVEKCHYVKQYFDNVNGPSRKWYRLIQTS